MDTLDGLLSKVRREFGDFARLYYAGTRRLSESAQTDSVFRPTSDQGFPPDLIGRRGGAPGGRGARPAVTRFS